MEPPVARFMEPQHIIDACETNWEAHKADCSGFVKAMALALAVKTFSAGDNADAIVDRLRAASDWTPLDAGDGAAARIRAEAATSGEFDLPSLGVHSLKTISSSCN
jgi:hypothetical protein